ncbi:MAG TPA: SDR family oxidoreductase [Aestuariivirgaceae bacterium]|nr:SDR family oxidoreductase [Aestuariivirgaceae bacterium]
MTSVLVLGAGGLVGRSVTQLLQSSFGCRVVALARGDCNVLDEGQLQCALQSHRPTAIINAAGFVPVDRAEADPENSYRLNFLVPLAIARAVRNVDSTSVLFHLSSDFVFDGISGNYDEDTAQARPLSYYGLHKSAADGALGFVHEQSYVLRIASYMALVASKRNFLCNMLGLLASGDKLTIVDDLQISLTTDLLLARTIHHFVETRPPFGVYNIVSQDSTTWFGLFSSAASDLGLGDHLDSVRPGTIEKMPGSALRPRHSHLNVAKLRWKAPCLLSGWRELVAEHCRHHRKEYRQVWDERVRGNRVST